MNTTQQQKILDLLSDGKWHCASEFAAMYMVDYRRRLVDLKQKGYKLQSRRCTKHSHPMKEWALVSNSSNLDDFLRMWPSKEKKVENTLF